MDLNGKYASKYFFKVLIFVFLAYTYACFGKVRGLVEGMNTPMPVINEYLLPDCEGSRLAMM